MKFFNLFLLFIRFKHDPEDDGSCTPGGENGNYIMFARATSGDKRNNNKFSPCSLKSVNAVLNTKARSLKGCFQGKLERFFRSVFFCERIEKDKEKRHYELQSILEWTSKWFDQITIFQRYNFSTKKIAYV